MPAELSHRERVRLALEHHETDRVPIAMICSGFGGDLAGQVDAYLKEQRGIGLEEYVEPLIDVKTVGPPYVGPPLPARTDMWGVRRGPVSYGRGEYNEIEYYPLGDAETVADIEAHDWPSPDWFDYAVLPERIAALRREGDHCLMASNGNIFESSWYMRGFERMFMDLAVNPDLADAIAQHVADFYCEHFRRILGAADGEIDLVFTADDVGGQQGLLMSLSMWAEHIKPHHERMNAVIHDFGAKVIYHSDGAVQQAVPGLIDMGIDVLQALQFDAEGMDPRNLKENYMDVLCFEGGVSVQHTLPFGTVEEVEQEVRDRIDVLGYRGGYILGPSHCIQTGTPPQNVVAMFETAAAHPMGRGFSPRRGAEPVRPGPQG